MEDLPVHTLICRENQSGCLLLCGINHALSTGDALLDAQGIDRSNLYKSFFSDSAVNDNPYRNRIVHWFLLWGYQLARNPNDVGEFEKSIVQTNWLQTSSNNMNHTNIEVACVEDSESFLQTCDTLKPKLILFFGKQLMWAFNSVQLKDKIQGLFGSPKEKIRWLQKDVYSNGEMRRRFHLGFQQYENVTLVALPHATGAKGVAHDYIESFQPEMSEVIDNWWKEHKKMLTASQ